MEKNMLKRILTLSTVMALSLTAYANSREEVPSQDELHLVSAEERNNEIANCGCEKPEETLLAHVADQVNPDHDQELSCNEPAPEETILCNADEPKEDASLAKCSCEEKDEDSILCSSEDETKDQILCSSEDDAKDQILCSSEDDVKEEIFI